MKVTPKRSTLAEVMSPRGELHLAEAAEDAALEIQREVFGGELTSREFSRLTGQIHDFLMEARSGFEIPDRFDLQDDEAHDAADAEADGRYGF